MSVASEIADLYAEIIADFGVPITYQGLTKTCLPTSGIQGKPMVDMFGQMDDAKASVVMMNTDYKAFTDAGLKERQGVLEMGTDDFVVSNTRPHPMHALVRISLASPS